MRLNTPLNAGTLVAILPNAIVLPVVMVDDNDSFAPWFNTSFCAAICFRKRMALNKIAAISATIYPCKVSPLSLYFINFAV